jgi:hypothetical protein
MESVDEALKSFDFKAAVDMEVTVGEERSFWKPDMKGADSNGRPLDCSSRALSSPDTVRGGTPAARSEETKPASSWYCRLMRWSIWSKERPQWMTIVAYAD